MWQRSLKFGSFPVTRMAGGKPGKPRNSLPAIAGLLSFLVGNLKDRRKHKAKCPPFTAITHDVLFHQRFLDLSSSAKVVYLAMAAKVKAPLGSGRYEYEFAVSYTELCRWGLSTATVSKAIKELQAKGLIELAVCGGLKGCQGTTSKYRLSEAFKKA